VGNFGKSRQESTAVPKDLVDGEAQGCGVGRGWLLVTLVAVEGVARRDPSFAVRTQDDYSHRKVRFSLTKS